MKSTRRSTPDDAAAAQPNTPKPTLYRPTTNEAYKTQADRRGQRYIQAGIEEADKALALKPDYFEALTYKNLLLRSMALVERDPGRQQALLKQADSLRDKAQELQKQKQASTTAPTKS